MKVSCRPSFICSSTWIAQVTDDVTPESTSVDAALARTQDGALSILQHKLERAVEAVKEARAELKAQDA